MYVIEVAQYLAAQGLVTYGGSSGDVAIAHIHSTAPAELVVLTPTGGRQSDSGLPYDTVTFQVRVRSAQIQTANDRLQAIYDALHGLSDMTMPGGTYTVSVLGIQAGPVYMGTDSSTRHEFVCNFEADIQTDAALRN